MKTTKTTVREYDKMGNMVKETITDITEDEEYEAKWGEATPVDVPPWEGSYTRVGDFITSDHTTVTTTLPSGYVSDVAYCAATSASAGADSEIGYMTTADVEDGSDCAYVTFASVED